MWVNSRYFLHTVFLVELLDPLMHIDPKFSKTVFPPRSLYNNQNCKNAVWIHFSLAEIILYINQRTRGMPWYSRIPKESIQIGLSLDTELHYTIQTLDNGRCLRFARDISQESWRFLISCSEVIACTKIGRGQRTSLRSRWSIVDQFPSLVSDFLMHRMILIHDQQK